jgi:hypothetical protein
MDSFKKQVADWPVFQVVDFLTDSSIEIEFSDMHLDLSDRIKTS